MPDIEKLDAMAMLIGGETFKQQSEGKRANTVKLVLLEEIADNLGVLTIIMDEMLEEKKGI